jgi:hypothetical protein
VSLAQFNGVIDIADQMSILNILAISNLLLIRSPGELFDEKKFSNYLFILLFIYSVFTLFYFFLT